MNGILVIIIALSLAFTWVEVLHWGHKKPFSCLKCMTGWISLILAYSYHIDYWYYYVFIGLFAGAIFSAIKYKYL
jgi:hypothetical protein